MKDQSTGYQTRPWPIVRNALISVLKQHRPHTVYGFGEVDITEALERISRYRRDLRIAVSLHAFVAYCLVQAVQRHPVMHTYRRGKDLICFDDIDLGTAIDRRLPGGVRLAVGYTIRAAQRKSLAEINMELRHATNIDLGSDDTVKLRRRVAALPGFIRNMISRRIMRDPTLLKRFHGTLGLTNLQSPGVPNAFHALPPNIFTYTAAIGSIVDRGGRKILCLSGGADHAIVDGLPLSRFAATLTHLLQSAAGLDDSFVTETRRLLVAESQPGTTA
ncbi:MAG: 2-oxo acid dehydrogenase subunit E2 [Alphaproteobacteria bacterium]|nr:2-oxo acid dehydrogenase subunit E2 [Alphaproteobacteria bacterium]